MTNAVSGKKISVAVILPVEGFSFSEKGQSSSGHCEDFVLRFANADVKERSDMLRTMQAGSVVGGPKEGGTNGF